MKIGNGPQLILLDSSIMQDTHMELLNLNHLLNQSESTSHISPHLQSGALISIGKLCDDGCISNFTATHISVAKDGLMALEGNRSSTTGTYHNPTGALSQKQPATLNALATRSKPELAKW